MPAGKTNLGSMPTWRRLSKANAMPAKDLPWHRTSTKKYLMGENAKQLGLVPQGKLLGSSAKVRKSEKQGSVLNPILYLAPDTRSNEVLQGMCARVDNKGRVRKKYRLADKHYRGSQPAISLTYGEVVQAPGESKEQAYAASVTLAKMVKLHGEGPKLRKALDRQLEAIGQNGTMCTFAKGCTSVCLVSAGQMAASTPVQGRMNKSLLYIGERKRFVDTLHKEINATCKRAKKDGVDVVGVRLNGTSDIEWEHPDNFGSTGLSALEPEACPDCEGVDLRFYDYTKAPPGKRQRQIIALNERRQKKGLPPVNYWLTYSYDPTVHPFRSLAQVASKKDPSEAFRRWYAGQLRTAKTCFTPSDIAKKGKVKVSDVEALLNGKQRDAAALKILKAYKVRLPDEPKNSPFDKDGNFRSYAKQSAEDRSWGQARQALDLGKEAQRRKNDRSYLGARSWSVAVGFESKKLVDDLVGNRWSLFPDVPVVDGDEHDMRFLDEPGVVALYPKGISGAEVSKRIDESYFPGFFQRVYTAGPGGMKLNKANGYMLTPSQGDKLDPYLDAVGFVSDQKKDSYRKGKITRAC